MSHSRRNFLAGVGALGLAGTSTISLGAFQEKEDKDKEAKAKQEKPKQEDAPKKPNQLDSKLVNRFVGQSHGNIKAVKEMLAKEPMLINAAWDWKEGDWETGLNAASHVGNRDIAELLLEHGARLDVCAAVMLGMDGVVKAMQTVNPKLHSVRGAHQIPLLHHAISGGKESDDVLTLLLESGADIEMSSNAGATALMAAAGSGRVELVEMLVKRGANVGAKNKKDQTALDIAKKRKKDDVVKYLETIG